jgi:hypothetical protein
VARSETDIRLAVLKQLMAHGATLPSDAIAAALDGPELGKAGADGRLRVTAAMIAPQAEWLRANRAAFSAALKENRVDLVD